MAMGRSRATYARPASRRTAFNLRAVALPGDHAAPADGERPRQARLSGASQGGRRVQRHSVTRFETHRREGLGGSSHRCAASARRAGAPARRRAVETSPTSLSQLTAAAAAAPSPHQGICGFSPRGAPQVLRVSLAAHRGPGSTARWPRLPGIRQAVFFCRRHQRMATSAASSWTPAPLGCSRTRTSRGCFPVLSAWRGHF